MSKSKLKKPDLPMIMEYPHLPGTDNIAQRLSFLVQLFCDGDLSQFSTLIDIPVATFRRHVRGEGDPNFRTLAAVIRVTGVKPQWLIFGELFINPEAQVITEATAAGLHTPADETYPSNIFTIDLSAEFYRQIRTRAEETQLVLVHSEAMPQTLPMGSVALIDRTIQAPTSGVLFFVTQQQPMFRRFIHHPDDRFTLSSESSPQTQDLDAKLLKHIQIIGQVKFVFKPHALVSHL